MGQTSLHEGQQEPFPTCGLRFPFRTLPPASAGSCCCRGCCRCCCVGCGCCCGGCGWSEAAASCCPPASPCSLRCCRSRLRATPKRGYTCLKDRQTYTHTTDTHAHPRTSQKFHVISLRGCVTVPSARTSSCVARIPCVHLHHISLLSVVGSSQTCTASRLHMHGCCCSNNPDPNCTVARAQCIAYCVIRPPPFTRHLLPL